MARPPRGERMRYIGFRVEVQGMGPPLERSELVEALDEAAESAGLPQRRRLTVFTGELGIALCSHTERDQMLWVLSSIDTVGGRPVHLRTLVTSGTIKKVKAHLGIQRDG